jgi:glyoxylase-like metal-dependent hydrolase (beta-lactamase superfamily II)
MTSASALQFPWADPPPPGSVIDVAPGIKWLRMPLPFALNHINLWLLEDDEGWVAVDTGVGLAPTRELWTKIFDAEFGGRPITRVLVTHFHPEPIDNDGWLVDRWGVDLWCTQAEWLSANLACQRNGAELERRLAHYRSHGFGAHAIDEFR